MKKTAAPLGIIGDGQLALLLGEAARAQDVDFLAFGADLDSPFARTFPTQYVFDQQGDTSSLTDFAKRCSVLTLENEFNSAETLVEVEKQSGTEIVPSPESYAHFENKIAQRRFYDSLEISGPRWAVGHSSPDQILTQLSETFSYPLFLKASQGGYDGYGVRLVASPSEAGAALLDFKHAAGRVILIEEKVSLKCELAQGALFDGKGNVVMLPLVETVQKNGICELVLSRPRLEPSILAQAKKEIETTLTKISGSGIIGLYSFEFFLTDDLKVLINEGAPRPHNSQHLSVNASPFSQFDLLVTFLATKRLPLTPSPISSEPGVMLNLLGKSSGVDHQLTLPALPEGLKAFPKLYQKKECRIGRKMGHLNLVDASGTLNLVEIGEYVLKEYQL